jgi:hypothetical protein
MLYSLRSISPFSRSRILAAVHTYLPFVGARFGPMVRGLTYPHRPKAASMWPVACGPHGPPPAPTPRKMSSPRTDARHQAPVVMLCFAEYGLSSAYICLSFSHYLFFRQSLLYDSPFNISIRTRYISTPFLCFLSGR